MADAGGWFLVGESQRILGLVAADFIAVGCLAAVLPHSFSPKAAPSPKSKPANSVPFGGATAIAPERWIKGIEYPEIQYVPRIVLVAFDITASGAAKNCTVAAPIPQWGFGEEVCAAVERNARFLPRRDAHGKAVSTRGRVRFRFEYNE